MTALIPRRGVNGILLAVGAFSTLSAIAGGIGLLTPGSIGIPLSFLEGSIFTSYLWPGLILLVVIGGTQAVATVAQWRARPSGLLWSAIAGFGMVIWIFVELTVIDFSVLHAVYFITGMAQLACVTALLGVAPRIVAGPEVATRR